MLALEAFRKLFSRICNPSSACPDVSIDYVVMTMAEILADQDGREAPDVDKRVLALISICGKIGRYEVSMEWEALTRRGPPDRFDLERFDQAEKDGIKEVEESIDRLLEGGHLMEVGIQTDDGRIIPSVQSASTR
jgi:hypothetical protein